MQNFLAAIDARAKPVADIEQGYISTTSCILANLSMKLGRSLTWDAQKGEIANDPEANNVSPARIAPRGNTPTRTPSNRPEARRVSKLGRTVEGLVRAETATSKDAFPEFRWVEVLLNVTSS